MKCGEISERDRKLVLAQLERTRRKAQKSRLPEIVLFRVTGDGRVLAFDAQVVNLDQHRENDVR